MTVRAFVFGLFALCASVCLRAQAPTQPPTVAPAGATGAKIAVEGCLERAQRNGSVGGTGLGTSSPPNTADRDANSSEALDVFQLTDADRVVSDAAGNGARTTYGLQGNEKELGSHTGHRVQVTGTLAAQSADRPVSSAAAAGIRRIRVDAVKMISAKCGAATGKKD